MGNTIGTNINVFFPNGGSPGIGAGAPGGMDPMQELMALMSQMQSGGGMGFGAGIGPQLGGGDPNAMLERRLRHLLNRLDHEIVDRLFQKMAGGGGANPLAGLLGGGSSLGGGIDPSMLGGGSPLGGGLDPSSLLGGGSLGGGIDPSSLLGGGSLGGGIDPSSLLGGGSPFGGGLDPSLLSQGGIDPSLLGGGSPCGGGGLPDLSSLMPTSGFPGSCGGGAALQDLLNALPPCAQQSPCGFPQVDTCGCPCGPSGPGQIQYVPVPYPVVQQQPAPPPQQQPAPPPPPPPPPPPAPRKKSSPLTFDLMGTGRVGTTGLANGRNFRMSPNGTKTAWAAPGEGMLAFGIKPGEMPKDGSQLLGNNANIGGQTGFANGFDALKALAQKTLPPAQFAAAMKRGSLNAQDIQMMEQKGGLTMVVAGKGQGQDRSVRPLEDLGITQLSLGYSQNGNATDENGNDHRQSAGFVMNGQQRKVDDVWYQVA